MRKLSNTIATKEYVPNTPGNCFTFNDFFPWKNFYIDFPLFNKHFKHQGKNVLFMMTATGFVNVKRLFKSNYQNASSRIVTFL